MKNRSYILLSVASVAIAATVVLTNRHVTRNHIKLPPKVRSSHSPKAAAQTIKNREAYFFHMLRDPAVNKIPNGIRSKELALYSSLPKSTLKSGSAAYDWSEAGPNDVGGRTRALAIDTRNSNIVIAGGVSGGIWKSTDQGESWQLKNSPDETYSVTSICQDTRSGQENNWYYASGEFNGNSADATGSFYSGYGIYKSTDNGETWNIVYGSNTAPFEWDNISDYISKIKVNPYNGDLILAAHSYGLIKLSETDGTYSLSGELGGGNDHVYCDFDIDSQGNILAVLSEANFNEGSTPDNSPGVYYKQFNATAFSQIDASSTTFPSTHDRSVIRFAPSNTNIGYVFTNIDETNISFHKIDLTNNELIDRTANLPAFDSNNGKLGPQANYNMTLAVKPDDEDFIIIGNTSLFRSNDGFASSPTKDYSWIGGYETDGGNGQYTNHHADCHITIFDPNNNDAVWSGHDGGLSYVADITQNTTASSLMPWIDKNNGYNVTQFYTIADINTADDDRYIGGTQDNGTPAFRYNTSTSGSENISSGDGGYCYLGANYAYVSSQNGTVIRTNYDAQNFPINPFGNDGAEWSFVVPADATGQLYINPFVINPNNEEVMYYAAGENVWINKAIEDIFDFDNSNMSGWSAPSVLDVPGYTVTTMAVSQSPANVLYYAAYAESGNPLVYKVENSTVDEGSLVRNDISINEANSGSYPNCIAINPRDANEIIVIFSNYNVPSIFYSSDGGVNYTQIDGNLSYSVVTTDPTASDVSVRGAAILNWDDEKTYYISTSIGLYKTQTLNGTSTVWENVATNNLGNVVCNMVKTSDLDGKVVTATHGRGIFVGKPSSGTGFSPESTAKNNSSFTVYPNPSDGMFNIDVKTASGSNMFISILDNNGRIVFENKFNSQEELNSYQFNLTDVSAGIYIIKLNLDNQVYAQKISIR
ncbi:T9SS type A sorting domain-containing protein [Saccharicrinis sp. GN24d3]|uniref:T9SS type A sorting domain-containing protein n=1 Tax=Saccharicrinis sp. GN24d3 TaxID=3458416 RepID=UPI0040354B1E